MLELYQQPGIFIEQVDRINNMAQRYEGGAIYQEVLMFPSITIHHVWADEDIGHNCGERTYQSGVETQEHLPTGQDAIELGCDLWDIDPEEFLCENQDSGMKIT